jgi:uncharacterized membrane protein YvbJ
MPYCTHCGAEVGANDQFCTQCGNAVSQASGAPRGEQPPQGQTQPSASQPGVPHVETHLVKAILSTLFCCLPFGIVAIVYASQVNTKLQARDYAGAQTASDKANFWGNLSIGLGLVAGLFYFLAMMGGM